MFKENILKNKVLIWSMLCGFIFIFSFSIIKNNPQILTLSPQSNTAQANMEYVPLSGNDIFPSSSRTSFSDLVSLFFKWGIAIAIILSILFIVIGGIQYMTTDAIFDKSEGKQKISSAVAGLILALSTWLILNTINPQILGLRFTTSVNQANNSRGGATTGGASFFGGGAASPNTTNNGSGVSISSSIINQNAPASGVTGNLNSPVTADGVNLINIQTPTGQLIVTNQNQQNPLNTSVSVQSVINNVNSGQAVGSGWNHNQLSNFTTP
ncbi:MAG TPA: hypothetical protein PKE08_01015 [Candidatus Paceibacterota bacterium]|nr:hypothetical protein [Candidatus Paceibacterota bacterium]